MAALRAKIMHKITKINFTNGLLNTLSNPQPTVLFKFHCPVEKKEKSVFLKAKKKPIIAKGIAKIVCENFIRLR